jgi:hypothetical protein
MLMHKLNEIKNKIQINDKGAYKLEDIINALYDEDKAVNKIQCLVKSISKLEIKKKEYENMVKTMIIDVNRKI